VDLEQIVERRSSRIQSLEYEIEKLSKKVLVQHASTQINIDIQQIRNSAVKQETKETKRRTDLSYLPRGTTPK
jgi:hypothetical protein